MKDNLNSVKFSFFLIFYKYINHQLVEVIKYIENYQKRIEIAEKCFLKIEVINKNFIFNIKDIPFNTFYFSS
jgi:hypothetical protein